MLMWMVGAKHHLKDHYLSQTETFTPVQLQCSLISGEVVLAAPTQPTVALLLGTNIGTSLPPWLLNWVTSLMMFICPITSEHVCCKCQRRQESGRGKWKTKFTSGGVLSAFSTLKFQLVVLPPTSGCGVMFC